MKSYIIAAFVVLAFVGAVSAATKCVKCTTLTNKDCADLYVTSNNAKYAANCTHGCKKGRVDTAGVVVLSRECASSKKTAKCSSSEINFFIKIKTTECYCDGDFCNSAPKMALPVTAILMSLIVSLKSLF